MTPKQQRFVEEYPLDMNAAQAAIRAGYSERTAKEQGYELLTKPHIADAIAEAQAERSERLQVSTDDVLLGFLAEANGEGPDTSSPSRVRSWELIGKHLGMFIERSETGAPGDFAALNDEELREKVARMIERARDTTERPA